MPDERGTLEILAGEIGLALGSLEGALTPDNFASLLLGMGLDAAPDLTGDAAFMQRLDSAVQRAQGLSAAVDALNAARASGDDAAALQAVSQLVTSIVGLVTSLKALADDFARATAALPNAAPLQALALDLAELLLGDAVVAYLDIAHPFLRRILSVLSVIEIDTTLLDDLGFDAPVVRRRLHLDRLGRVLSDPASIFRDAYGWGSAFDAAALFATVRDVFDVMQPIAIATAADDIAPADLDLFASGCARQRPSCRRGSRRTCSPTPRPTLTSRSRSSAMRRASRCRSTAPWRTD
jgi:hypothetical protein